MAEVSASSTSGKVFLCYRRDDSGDITGRFYDRLVQRFGREAVFKDVDSIPLGVDFRTHIDQIIKQVSVVIVMIGDRWLEARTADGKARLDEPLDHVRIEIQSALARDIPIIPLLVRDAVMPGPEGLPEALRNLAYRNGTAVRPDPHFHSDATFVIGHLERMLAPPEHAPATPSVAPTPKSDSSIQRPSATVASEEAKYPKIESPSTEAKVPAAISELQSEVSHVSAAASVPLASEAGGWWQKWTPGWITRHRSAWSLLAQWTLLCGLAWRLDTYDVYLVHAPFSEWENSPGNGLFFATVLGVGGAVILRRHLRWHWLWCAAALAGPVLVAMETRYLRYEGWLSGWLPGWWPNGIFGSLGVSLIQVPCFATVQSRKWWWAATGFCVPLAVLCLFPNPFYDQMSTPYVRFPIGLLTGLALLWIVRPGAAQKIS